MSRGKYLSLKEARQKNKQGKDKIDQFCREHPSMGNKTLFNKLFKAMVNGTPKKPSKAAKA